MAICFHKRGAKIWEHGSPADRVALVSECGNDEIPRYRVVFRQRSPVREV